MIFPRITGILLSATLALPVLLTVATPAQANGCISPAAGTAEDPYLIATSGNLNCLMTNSVDYWTGGKYFRQTADIDLSGSPWTHGIGDGTTAFVGTYDGQGFAITGLSINQPSASNIGLFGSIQGATLRSITVSGNVVGNGSIGGLVGISQTNSSITDCHSSVTVTTGNSNANDDAVGGLVGYMITGTITSSSTIGSVSWGGADPNFSSGVGGLVGIASQATITESWSTSVVSGRTRVGGLVGDLSLSVVQRSYATGVVSGKGGVGGLVGFMYRMNPVDDMIIDSYARGAIFTSGPGPAYQGGSLAGRSELNWEAATRSYGTGAVTGGGDKGGIIGSTPADWSASFWDTSTTGISTAQASGAVPGVSGKSTAEMTDIATYQAAGWSISNVIGSGATWGICLSVNDGYPFLHALTRTNPCAVAAQGDPPPPWPQAYARAHDEACLPGWNPSWAEWPNGRTGGFVCQRTLVYNQSSGQWDVRRAPAFKVRTPLA